MDDLSVWLHNLNVDETLDKLGTYVQPITRDALLKILVEEEDKLGVDLEQLENTARRVREGRERIGRVLTIVEGLAEHGLMDEEKLSRALSVIANMRHAQRLVEQCYQAMRVRHQATSNRADSRLRTAEHPGPH